MSKRKKPDDANINQQISKLLIEIADYERNVNRNIHKYSAYRTAASTVEHYPSSIRSGEEAKKLKGVGTKIAAKIQEFIDTGKLSKLEKIKNDDKGSAINELMRVTGIGPSKARQLVEEGVTSIEDLRKQLDKLNHHQKVGLKHIADFEKRIPRPEIEEIESYLRKIMKKLDTKMELTICGSYRRGLASSGDIDGLIRHPEFTSENDSKCDLLKHFVERLQENELVTDVLSLGSSKFMGVCRLRSELPFRRLDLRLIPFDQYHCGVLYFTGSDMFNKEMRSFALEKGFTLNEYTLRPIGATGVPGEPLPIASEREVFDYIDYDYKEPRDRNV